MTLFTENETNHARLFPGVNNESPYVKDGINDFVVGGIKEAVNPPLFVVFCKITSNFL